MSRKPLTIVILVLALAGAGFWIYSKTKGESAPEFRFTAIERGDLEAAVSATGTLNAVTSVQVGTQVSGQVSDIYVDFNDNVKKGQLIARIDPTLQQQAVQESQASRSRAQAELERAKLEYQRNKSLFENKVLTEVEFNSAKYSYSVAEASAKSAEISLERARRNLEYTSIHSPIDGIVVSRAVNVGQTVAASYSTPELFVIAEDLKKMQILALVDESDIGSIKPGLDVRFTVQAYPDRKFEGKVEQVRLQSKTQENVVNYTVVVGLNNADGKLLPGMTATLEFLTGTAKDVLLVPNTALRFRPPEAMMAQLREEMQAQMRERMQAAGVTPPAGGEQTGAGAGGAGGGNRPSMNGAGGGFPPGGFNRMGGGAMPGMGGAGRGRSDRGMLYYINDKGKLSMMMVRVGISDGQKTEIKGREVKEGMQVITGLTQQPGAQPQTQMQNPFAPQQQRGPGGRRGGGGGMF